MMICSHCGQANPDDARYCRQCGKPRRARVARPSGPSLAFLAGAWVRKAVLPLLGSTAKTVLLLGLLTLAIMFLLKLASGRHR